MAGMGLPAAGVVLVTDIGCSGLLDTLFETHALHGLHGRALTYAAGVKLARPEVQVIAVMGDGGMGIGGAHFLEACRRNLNMTLLVLNNFNFGMTGGQFSCTTPAHARVPSGFLNRLERPTDICAVGAAAGASFVRRSSVYAANLAEMLAEAIAFNGFSLVELWGPCTGRYTKRNPMKPQDLEERLKDLPAFSGPISSNLRPEYGEAYRATAALQKAPDVPGMKIDAVFSPVVGERREVVLLGAAGNRVLSAGTLLAHAAVLSGLQVTQKNDYDVTVMRGPSVSELILSPERIDFAGVHQPDLMVALSREGVSRRLDLFGKMGPGSRLVRAKDVEVPRSAPRALEVDFKAHGIRGSQRALACLFLIARTGDPITLEMLLHAAEKTLEGKVLEDFLDLMKRTAEIPVEF